MVIDATLLRERTSRSTWDERKALSAEVERVIALLAADPTPESDSPVDPVWGDLGAVGLPGAAVDLKDVSSALNPNWAQKNVFTRTALKALLVDSSAPDALQQRREDNGFSMNLEDAYGDLFVENALEKWFTPYGYPNVNTTDEFALRSLFALRTGDAAGAEIFHARIQQVLAERRILKTDQLRGLFGIDYDKLYPVLNVEPSMNAHYVDPLILRDILAYPDLKVPQPAQATLDILDARAGGEMTAETLHRLIGAPVESRIYQYFGVTTWFWRITVTHGHARQETVVARIPTETESPVRFAVVEQRFEP